LPLIQYTAREVRSGLQFLAFAQHRSPGARALFAYRIQSHLSACGLDLPNLVWQTANGGEFIGALQPDGARSGFPRAVRFFDSQHQRIPPAAHTYQRDVETVHRLIEDEFYDLETFRRRRDFLAKACVYQFYFNLVRPNPNPSIAALGAGKTCPQAVRAAIGRRRGDAGEDSWVVAGSREPCPALQIDARSIVCPLRSGPLKNPLPIRR